MQRKLYCKYKFIIMTVVSLLLMFFVIASKADKSTIENSTQYRDSRFTKSNETQSRFKQSDIENAKMWSLTLADWSRYKKLMRGPQGIWTPNLDPLTVLGINARTEQERRRIAKIQIKLEHRRLQNTLAYDRTYAQIGKEYFGNQLLVDTSRLKNRIALSKQAYAISQKRKALKIGDRLLLFVSLKDCRQCQQKAHRALTKARAKAGVGVDIFFVNSTDKDKSEIQTWARSIGITSTAINNGKVSLNFDRGTLSRITRSQGKVPLLLRRRGSHIAPEN